jgi:hypothetical protein
MEREARAEKQELRRRRIIGFTSLFCLVIAAVVLSNGPKALQDGLTPTIFVCSLLALGVGGLASLFGGTAQVSFGRWGKFTGAIAVVMALEFRTKVRSLIA